MSWGGRWQKGLSYQARVAPISQQGKDQTTRAGGLWPQLPASRAALGRSGPGLAEAETIAPLCSPLPIPSTELPRLWGGAQLGCAQGSEPEVGHFPSIRPLGLEVGHRLSCFLSRDLLILEMLPGQGEGAEGIVGLLGSGLGQELLRNGATWACWPPQLFPLLVPCIPCHRCGGFPFSFVSLGRMCSGPAAVHGSREREPPESPCVPRLRPTPPHPLPLLANQHSA